MAEKLTLDDGVLELEINGNGVLRFNPSDPNVYQRFLALARELPEMEKQWSAEAARSGEQADEAAQAAEALDRLKELDADVKRRLGEVFGGENDFDALLGGVNLMAMGRNGQRVVTNLLAALGPYMEEGVERYRRESAEAAVAQAKRERALRGAR